MEFSELVCPNLYEYTESNHRFMQLILDEIFWTGKWIVFGRAATRVVTIHGALYTPCIERHELYLSLIIHLVKTIAKCEFPWQMNCRTGSCWISYYITILDDSWLLFIDLITFVWRFISFVIDPLLLRSSRPLSTTAHFLS